MTNRFAVSFAAVALLAAPAFAAEFPKPSPAASPAKAFTSPVATATFAKGAASPKPTATPAKAATAPKAPDKKTSSVAGTTGNATLTSPTHKTATHTLDQGRAATAKKSETVASTMRPHHAHRHRRATTTDATTTSDDATKPTATK